MNEEEQNVNLMQQRSNLMQAYASGDKDAIKRVVKNILVLNGDESVRSFIQESTKNHETENMAKEKQINAMLSNLGGKVTVESFASMVEGMKEKIAEYGEKLNVSESDYWEMIVAYIFEHT